MPKPKYERVTVTVRNGQLTCTPDWVHLKWKDGPEDIRWRFEGIPESAVGVAVEFLAEVPANTPAPPPAAGAFRPRGVHRGVGQISATPGSRLPDLVTTGNTREAGHFYYDVKLLDGEGNVVAHADPGGDNQPGTGPN